MYKRVIKSGQTLYVREKNAGPGEPDVRPEAEDVPQDDVEGADIPSREDIQAAYDELLAAAQEEASLILDDARREARSVADGAQAAAAEIRDAARAEGHEAGVAEGREKGLSELREEMRELLERGQAEADRVLREAYEARDRMLDEMEPKIYKLALDIAEKILSHELDHNEEAFMAILSQAVGSIRAETKVTLRVNASEFMRYFHSRDQARIRTENGPVTAGVMIDASVEPGGCLIETDTGMIDASVRAQIEQIAFNLGVERQ